MILFIDNYDSFTYNLVQYFQQLNQQVSVYKNDEIDLATIETMSPNAIVIGPGPGTPAQAGISLAVIKHFYTNIPILGICLGHQAIGQAFGSHIIPAKQIMHGRVSNIHHNNFGVFKNLPTPFKATRYHSLVLDKNQLPECLEVTAWTETTDGLLEEVMGIRHHNFNIEGVQFHPESILSEEGFSLLNNFLQAHGLAK